MSTSLSEIKGEGINAVWARFADAVSLAVHRTTDAAIRSTFTHGCDGLDIRLYVPDSESLERTKTLIHQISHTAGAELVWKESTTSAVVRPYVTTEATVVPMGSGFQLGYVFVLHRAEG